MNALKNRVQLIGNLGADPETIELESKKKLVKCSLATNDSYKNAKGEKVEETQWHSLVAWGKVGEILETYGAKGKQIAIEGKLQYRSYEDNEGVKRYSAEIKVNEILLLGDK